MNEEWEDYNPRDPIKLMKTRCLLGMSSSILGLIVIAVLVGNQRSVLAKSQGFVSFLDEFLASDLDLLPDKVRHGQSVHDAPAPL